MEISILAGSIIALLMISSHFKWRNGHWSFPLCLVSLPFFYVAFALYAQDYSSIGKELAAGIPFFIIGLAAINKRFASFIHVLAYAWIAHGIYDLAHDHLFINAGTPSWYPVFCATVDIVLGAFLLYLHKCKHMHVIKNV